MLGRYLDGLPRAARERLITASHWCVRGYVDGNGGRSLLGHAEDWGWNHQDACTLCRAPELLALREAGGDSWLNWPPLIDVRYDHLVERVGLARAVKFLQQRAARSYLRFV